jgi:hypothetical protein
VENDCPKLQISNKSMIDSLITVDGSMEEYQDKVVTKGFSQQEGVDLDETLTPVVQEDSPRKRELPWMG